MKELGGSIHARVTYESQTDIVRQNGSSELGATLDGDRMKKG